MLFARSKNLTWRTSGPTKRVSPNYKNTLIIFIGIGIIFSLIVGSLISLYSELNSLKEDKRFWSEAVVEVQAPKKENIPKPLSVEELPTLIDQCVRTFQKENSVVYRFNLERFGEEKVNSSVSHLNFALVRFHLKGSWEGFLKGITEVEAETNKGIRVQEALVYPGGGEILLKIYYQEPDNPPSP